MNRLNTRNEIKSVKTIFTGKIHEGCDDIDGLMLTLHFQVGMHPLENYEV